MTLDSANFSSKRDVGQTEGKTSSVTSLSPKRTPDEIQQWMVAYFARHLDTHPDEIDVTASFERFGLDSAAAIEMSGDLEEWVGERVDPMLVYDYPTIEDMAGYLGSIEA
jgi:acyl carrier protein